ncbi:MAG: UDP-N-acetylmuramoyl-L-alanine--D-glutamate ligase [Bdellovibrionales bacterium]|nr:UDP-N-acetylmuramoyl-L-alanine--D-glutamate ligase [Bdellovibrionales bacterium]
MAKNSSPLSNKTVVILGLTKSTAQLARTLQQKGATVKVSEANPKDNVLEAARELSALKPEPETEFGKNSPAFFEGAHQVVVADGIRADTPPLPELAAKGIPVAGETEILLREVDIPIIAVAGTGGKTTVALLLKAMFDTAGRKAVYVGDMGESLAGFVASGASPEYLILELSSERLENLRGFRPQISVLTSMQPPFPDRYTSPEEFQAVMRNMIRNLDEKCAIIYNFRDANLKNLVLGNPAPKWVYRRKDPALLGPEIARIYKGSFLVNQREMVWTDTKDRELYDVRDFRPFGLHNKDNLMAALNVAKLAGLHRDAIQQTIRNFDPVPHRLEFVKKKGGVRIVNDSRATGIHTLRVALEAFPLDPVILIAGGRDAQSDFTQLTDVVKGRVKTLILVGEAKEHINRCLGDHTETYLVGTFEEAVLMSYQKSREGDVILLAPGCESYDMFVSYEERGNYFKKYVDEI